MKLLPRSMARQTTLVLVVGMTLVVLGGVSIASLTLIGAARADGTHDLLGRVATLVAIAQEAPADARPAIYAATARSGLAVSPSGRSEPVALFPDLWTRSLE